MLTQIILLGNSIAAQVLYSMIARDCRFEVVAFAVNEEFITEKQLYNLPVVPLEKLSEYYSPQEFQLVNAVGYSRVNRNREAIYFQAKEQGFSFVKYIHPSASVMSDDLGEGVIVLAGSVLEPCSRVANNVVIWSNVVVAHHAIIHENCWLASGGVISGQAELCRNTFVGVNATIVNQVSVSQYNIIGAGALITKDTMEGDVILARSGEKHRVNSEKYAEYCRL